MISLDHKIIRYQALMELIRPLLAGHPPEVQGSVLADLLAYWLASHPEAMRPGLLRIHVDGVLALLEANLKERSANDHN